jgi:hypothetical protein
MNEATDDFDYDLAISFLARDEPLALQIREALPALRVFVYSKAQEEVAATDGIETFSEVFRHRARLLLVLCRSGWAKTPWTRVEETAIKDRCLESGWDQLLFVRLERGGDIPRWVPDSYIYLDFQSFGMADLIGVVKAKLAKLGVDLRPPSAAEHAARLAVHEAFDQETQRLLMTGGRTFLDAAERLFEELDQQIEAIRAQSGWTIVHGHDNGQYVAFLDRVSMQLLPKALYVNSSRDAHFMVRHFDGRLLTPAEIAGRMMTIEQPRELSREKLQLVRAPVLEWIWEFRGHRLPHAEAARLLLTEFLERRTRAMRQ